MPRSLHEHMFARTPSSRSRPTRRARASLRSRARRLGDHAAPRHGQAAPAASSSTSAPGGEYGQADEALEGAVDAEARARRRARTPWRSAIAASAVLRGRVELDPQATGRRRDGEAPRRELRAQRARRARRGARAAAARWRARIALGVARAARRPSSCSSTGLRDVERGAGGGEAADQRRVRADPADPQAGPERLAHRADRDHGLAAGVERGDGALAASARRGAGRRSSRR